MIYLPLAIAVAAAAVAAWPVMGPAAKGAVAALLLFAMLLGLPLRLAAVATQWRERDPARLADFVDDNLGRGELALVDFKLYYAAIGQGTQLMLPTYVPAMRAAEKGRVQVLALRREDLAPAEQALGDGWRPTGARLVSPVAPRLLRRFITELREENYPVEIYRRTR